MDEPEDDLNSRIRRFADSRTIKLESQLGFGQDGIVYSTDDRTAVKFYEYERSYTVERDVYLRLRAESVQRIGQFKVPEILQWDDELWVVQMTFVSPPFVLDFAKCHLDRPPDYPAETILETRRTQRELFTADEFLLVMHQLEQ
ncbi:MAG: hypothetical protein MI757_12080 [Pirellulales bacterium]|nr:hypothetical protein [Pirellulales bacterium]